MGVSYHRRTPRKPLSRCVARRAAPKAALIAGYSLHLLHTKEVQMHLLFVIHMGLNPRRKLYNRRGDESGCILSQANTQKTAVKVHSPQRGAEGGLDSGIFPSPAFCYYNTLHTEPFSREGVTVYISYLPSELFASIISTQISVYSLYHISIRIKNIFDIKFIVWK